MHVPLQALAHYYVVTEAIPGLARGLPTIKSSDDWMYVKNEGDGLMVGFFEPGSYPWQSRRDPRRPAVRAAARRLGPPRTVLRDRHEADSGADRLPASGCSSAARRASRPTASTTSARHPNLQNFFIAAGFNSTGFLTGPGIGSVLADWLVDGRPSIDLPEADPARVMPHETNRRFLEQRVKETLDVAYDMHWPYYQRQSARPLRRSPLHDRTAANGAVFGELLGWERPNWYAPEGVDREYVYSYGRQNWFEHAAAEHRAVREAVGVFDISTYGKFVVQGRDAVTVLQRICAADIDVRAGPHRLHAVAQPLRRDRSRRHCHPPRATTSSSCSRRRPPSPRDLAWIRRHIADDEFATVTDVSRDDGDDRGDGARARASCCSR